MRTYQITREAIYFLVSCCTLLLPSVSYTQYFNQIEFERPNVSNAFKEQLEANIFGVIEDKQGYIWAATSKGMQRYDGRNMLTLEYSSEDGVALENTLARTVFEDSHGELWFGTDNGLYRYNYVTSSIKRYTHCKTDTTSINNNQVWSIYEDSKGRLWVGTKGGLNQFYYETETFSSYESHKTAGDAIDSQVIDITEDAYNNLWVSAWGSGLKMILPNDESTPNDGICFLSFEYDEKQNRSNWLNNNFVSQILIDAENRMWLSVFEGGINLVLPPAAGDLSSYTEEDFQFAIFKNNTVQNYPLPDNMLFSIGQDKSGYIWLGSTNGLGVFHPSSIDFSTLESIERSFEKLKVQIFVVDEKNNTTIPGNHLWEIYQDSNGIIWFATMNGLAKYVPFRERFQKQMIINEETDAPIAISAFLKDKEERLYIATPDYGLFTYNKTNNTHQPLDINVNLNGEVSRLHKTEDGLLWIGARTGLYSYSEKKGTIRHPLKFPNNPNAQNHVRTIFEDSDGQFWIGTNSGLVQFDRINGEHRFFEKGPAGSGALLDNTVMEIVEDENRTLYIATLGGGLNVISLDNIGQYNFKLLRDLVKDSLNILPGDLTSVARYENDIWIGSGRGVIHYNMANNQLVEHKKLAKKINTQVQDLECDRTGKVWIATLQGLFSYDAEADKLCSFNNEDGIPNRIYYTGGYKDDDDLIYFGGQNGYISFDGELVEDFVLDEKVLITELKIAGKPVKVNEEDKYLGKPILEQTISATDEINLSTEHLNIGIGFALLNHIYSTPYTYSYRMLGLEEDWHYTRHQINESYGRLPAGRYTFEVGVQINDAFISEPTRLKISVKAPFWKTNIFILSMILTALFLIYSFFNYRTYLIEREKENLEVLVQQRTQALEDKTFAEKQAREAAERERQSAEIAQASAEESRSQAERANKAKTAFLANMSHEIRTPMNGVLGMLELLSITSLDEEQKDYLDIMQKSGISLLGIINDILDFTKIESGKLELDNSAFYLQPFLENIVQFFEKEVQKKQLSLKLNISDCVPAHILSDSTRLQQILVNLVNNAIKFTHVGGININVTRVLTKLDEPLKLHFEILDTGIGIPDDKRNVLFNAFTQGDASVTRKYGGTGLGLAISMRLVELLGGKISLDSTEGVGSNFNFTISTKEVPITKGMTQNIQAATKIPTTALLPSLSPPNHVAKADSSINILIVEDNKFNQMLLRTVLLKMNYNPAIAENGKEAVQSVQESTFDLIFMDLNMPVMSGMDATKLIRQNTQLDKQPMIVALTANVQKEVKEECFALGMQEFISKPFKLEQIRTVINECLATA